MKQNKFQRIPVNNLLKGVRNFLIIVLFISCTRINPDKPSEEYTAHQDIYKKQPSTLNLPVSIPVKQIEKIINKKVSGVLYEDTSFSNNNDDQLKIRISKHKALDFNVHDSLFKLSIPLKVWAKAGWKYSKFGMSLSHYEETSFKLRVHYITKVGLNEDWSIDAHTSGNGFEWISEPILKIGPIEIPIKSVVDDVITQQQKSIAKTLDKKLKNKLALKDTIATVWQQLQEPFLLSKKHNTWLKITPQKVFASPFRSKNNQLKITVGLKGFTETFVGEKPYYSIDPNLPSLTIKKNIPENFRFSLSSSITMKKANKFVRKQVKGDTFRFKGGAYSIRIKDIALYGQSSDLIVSTTIDGDLTGTLYLRGHPYYDYKNKAFRLKDLKYDLRTKKKLVKAASWLAKGKFTSLMEQNLSIPMGKRMKQAGKKAQKYMDNYKITDNIILDGKLKKLRPKDIYITPDYLTAVLTATGKTALKIKF